MAFAQQDRVGKRASIREFIEAQRDQRAIGDFGQMFQRILAGDDLDADRVRAVRERFALLPPARQLNQDRSRRRRRRVVDERRPGIFGEGAVAPESQSIT